MESESGEDFEDIFDGEKVPAALQKELDALKAETEEVKNWKYEQELAKETEKYTVELESEMAELKKHHNINEAHEIAIYDLMNSALSAGREITVSEASRQLQQMIGAFPPAGQEAAPTIVGSSGGAGIPAPDRSVPKDDAGKKAMMAAMFEEWRKANQ
jgi:hypothetical protein